MAPRPPASSGSARRPARPAFPVPCTDSRRRCTMPSQLEPAREERFGDLLDQLRATHVEPSTELTERVGLMGRLEPARRRPLFRRRPALVLAFAAALLLGGAVVAGVVAERGGRQESAPGAATVRAEQGGSAADSSTKEFAPTHS